MKHKVNIKPLSVNDAWKGRRFKTDKYTQFEKEMLYLLPNKKNFDVGDGEIAVSITFGFSSRGSDIDNGIKPLFDILQKKYGFNDNKVYDLRVRKTLCSKGDEFIEFEITNMEGL